MTTEPTPFRLDRIPVHLGLGATVIPQDPFTGAMDWYERYGQRNAADGAEGRLVIIHTFTESWDSWEMHPHGQELVVCTDGAMTAYQEIEGQVRTVELRAGDALINPVGVWHTADVAATATALFVTAGMGTENRPR
jgi:quercetin dioxygenase-like cupin family protein